ncbi:MAG: four helix bundle protein [Pyrinomonadaceae bacterium]|nr:four helix bundle protein [Pyrinomonadaceae bacterium]
MPTFRRFEDIDAWKKARILTKEIYLMTSTTGFSRDFRLRDQIRRSTVSISANIAEGQGRRSDREFANFVNIALGSLAETKSHQYMALDLKFINQKQFQEIYGKLDEVGRMTFGLCKHLRKK